MVSARDNSFPLPSRPFEVVGTAYRSMTPLISHWRLTVAFNRYNRTGRGFPDVAAQSVNFHVIDKGQEMAISGTSPTAPTFAGIVALLNVARIEAEKPVLGSSIRSSTALGTRA